MHKDHNKPQEHPNKNMRLFLLGDPIYNIHPPSPAPYPLLVKGQDSKEEICGHRLLASHINALAPLTIGFNLNMSAGDLGMKFEIYASQETMDA
jgi:hypothetical protein